MLNSRLHASGQGACFVSPSKAPVRQRPRTATGYPRRVPNIPDQDGGSPIFGCEAVSESDVSCDSQMSQRHPSERQMTLGRMLRSKEAAKDAARRRNEHLINSFQCTNINSRAESPSDVHSMEFSGRHRRPERDRPRAVASPSSRQNPIPTLRPGLNMHVEWNKKPLEACVKVHGNNGLGQKKEETAEISRPPPAHRATRTPCSASGPFKQRATTTASCKSTRPANIHRALEMALRAANDSRTPRRQFEDARKSIADMKRINTKDSTGELLCSTQVMGANDSLFRLSVLHVIFRPMRC